MPGGLRQNPKGCSDNGIVGGRIGLVTSGAPFLTWGLLSCYQAGSCEVEVVIRRTLGPAREVTAAQGGQDSGNEGAWPEREFEVGRNQVTLA